MKVKTKKYGNGGFMKKLARNSGVLLPVTLILLFIIIISVFLLQKSDVFSFSAFVNAESVEIKENIPYGNLSVQKLDMCKPVAVTGNTPGVILIHGGGGDKSSFRKPCTDFARSGFIAISVNYRESPPPSYQLMIDDMNAAISWLKDRPNVRSDRIGAYGGSLGGYLASVAGTFETDNKVRCVENNFGPTDFTDPNFEGNQLYGAVEQIIFGRVAIVTAPFL